MRVLAHWFLGATLLSGCGAELVSEPGEAGDKVDLDVEGGKGDAVDRNPGSAPLPPRPPAAAPLRVGTHEPYDASSPDDLAAGAAYEAVVERAGATFVKIHFAALDLAEGDQVLVIDADGELVDRFTARAQDAWASRVRGSTARVRLEAGPAARRGGFRIDKISRGTVDLDAIAQRAPGTLESVCGADDKRAAACFGGAVAEAARAVGHMTFESGGGTGACTGSLVSAQGHFITNNHCIASQADVDSLEVRFNYQNATCTGAATAAVTSVKGGRFLRTSDPLDYTLVLLPDNPAAAFGHLAIDARDLAVGDEIYIAQHPGGRKKEIATTDSQTGGACTVRETNVSIGGYASRANVGYTCDTEGGSSGSPVISASSHRLVALHHLGGCNNNGTSMRDIYPQISSLLGGEPPPPPPPPPPAGEGFVGENTTGMDLPDLVDARSTIDVPAGVTAGTVQVALDITHSWRGDLEITLIAPSGRVGTVVRRSNPNDSADDIRGTFTVTGLEGEGAGAWRLRIRDRASQDTGRLDAWRLAINAQL